MEKIRFQNTVDGGNGDWDGNTLPGSALTYALVNGFWQATLPGRVGRLPAGLYGKAPAGDPYLMIATMWTTRVPNNADVVGVDTNAPVRNRDRWIAFPGNIHVSIVRPDDTLTFFQQTTGQAWLELLIEPLANTNEFGEVLLNYVREAREEKMLTDGVEAELTTSANLAISPWAGTLRIISTAAAGIILTYPSATTQNLTDLLIVERDGTGNVQHAPPVGQLINGQATITQTTNHSVLFVRGSGTRYSAAGAL